MNNLPPTAQAWTSGLVVQGLAWIPSQIGSTLLAKAVAVAFFGLKLERKKTG